MTRRVRNLICLWIIVLGLCNFAAYTVVYSYIGGDARNGGVEDGHFYVGGHFIHGVDGEDRIVSKGIWIYSYLHSITIWPTVAALLVSTLVLARPHIIATMREGVVGGQTLIAVFSTVIVLISGAMTAWFLADFVRELLEASHGG
ncbi:MAG: hypothetical protein GXY33_14950 [Phycisphaerae bacterium]|nr:hypothetical protein [Phycisphaerae bacterium]